MRILLSGASGFLGSHMLRHLLTHTDAQVVCPVSFSHRGVPERITLAWDGIPDAQERTEVVRVDLSCPIADTTAAQFARPDVIVNYAAQSHVDRSIIEPVPFVRNNVELMLHLLQYARTVPDLQVFLQISTDEVYGPAPAGLRHSEWSPILPSNPYSCSKACQESLCVGWWRSYGLPVTIVNCWDMDTEVLSADGPRRYDDLQVGDEVWTLNEDEELTLERVLRKVRMPGPAEMVRLTGHTEQLVTPDHRMMLRESVGSPRRWGPITEMPAAELATKVPSGRVQFVRTGQWFGDSRSEYLTDSLISRPAGRGGNRLPDRLPASWLARFFGWWVTEGSSSGRGQVHLCGMKPGQQDLLRSLFEEIGMERIRSGPAAVMVSSQELKRLIDLCGGRQAVRRVPRFIKDMDQEYLEEFLDAAIAGDGTRYGTRARIYTMNRALAYDYAEVAMKCGYSAKVSSRVTAGIGGRPPSKTWYTSIALRTGSHVSAANVEVLPHDGADVWCISVPSGRAFITRNEGGIVLTGQSMNLLGETQDPEKFVPSIMRALVNSEPVKVHTLNGVIGSRHYLHARNLADGVLWLLQHQTPPATWPDTDRPDRWHVAGTQEVNNLQMAELVAYAAGMVDELKVELVESHRPGHDLRYALDTAKINQAGWVAPVDLGESLERTVWWTMQRPQWLHRTL